jgi:hypothetical protein
MSALLLLLRCAPLLLAVAQGPCAAEQARRAEAEPRAAERPAADRQQSGTAESGKR